VSKGQEISELVLHFLKVFALSKWVLKILLNKKKKFKWVKVQQEKCVDRKMYSRASE